MWHVIVIFYKFRALAEKLQDVSAYPPPPEKKKKSVTFLFHQTAELTFCVKVLENGNNTSHDLFILPQFDSSDTSVCKKARGANQC